MTIYVTFFDHVTKEITAGAADSGFSSFDEVELINGAPLCSGKRTRTYAGAFYSDYCLTTEDG